MVLDAEVSDSVDAGLVLDGDSLGSDVVVLDGASLVGDSLDLDVESQS